MNGRLTKKIASTAQNIAYTVMLAAALLQAASCCKEESRDPGSKNWNNVMIFYSCAQNNLDNNIKGDIREMTESEGAYLPTNADGDAIVVCHHGCKQAYTYSESGPTYVIWIYRDANSGLTVRDTLTRAQYTTTTDPDVMRELLSGIKSIFKSDHYGIVFSSHGSGWLPQGSYEEEGENDIWTLAGKVAERRPYSSFGQEKVGSTNYYMDITDMAVAFPMKMDYIIMDACLMGCVEVAYELSDVTDVIGFSQAEVMSDGFCYKTMSRHLLAEKDPAAVMKDTYEMYESSGSTSVVSCVNCRNMGPLAECCGILTEKYRDRIAELDEDDVQRFYRGSHPWYFDLQDIFVQCGAEEEDLEALQEALDGCVMYKAHTNSILHTIPVNTNCGFSTYLPQFGNERLNNFYKTLAWNKVTGLVE